MHSISEQNIFIFLVQVFLLLSLAKIAGESLRRRNLPAFTGEILVGILLGPTIFGRFLPWLYQFTFPLDPAQQNMLETVAWLGILFLLLETGLEMDFSSAIRQGRDALVIACSATFLPIIISFGACLFLPDRYLVNPDQRILFALFAATMMSINATPVAARALHDLNILKTDFGFLVLSAMSFNDMLSFLVFTIIFGLFAQATINVIGIFFLFFITIIFTILCLTKGRQLVDSAISEIKVKKDEQPMTALTFICLLGLFCGALAQRIGIYALFGFFVAGIMAGSAKALSERTRHVISQMVHAIFVPLFFASIGLKIDVFKNFDLLLVVFVTMMSILGKLSGAWIGVNLTKTPKSNRLPIAIAHTSGGVMEIVIGLLALQYHLITESLFIALIFAAIASSILLGPWLSSAIKKRKEISVLEFFSYRAIESDLGAIERDTAIWELCNLAAEQEPSLDAYEIYKTALAREQAMGTAMEEGVAVPHARLPFLKKPFIVFGKSTKGIDWNAPDGKPTRFIFLILTREHDDDIQVQILASVARAMSNVHIRHEILTAKDKDDLWLALNKALTSQIIARKKIR